MDPNLSAIDVHVFWLPTETPFVVPVTHALPDSTSALTLETLSAEPAHAPYAAIGSPGRDFQLVLLTEEAKQPLAVLLTLDADLPTRLETVRGLWLRLTTTRPVEAPGRLTQQRRNRLIEALRALDARMAGANIRAIAATLFGAERIPSGPEWKSHDLRSRAKRLVASGAALMNGRYRDLLRPSRSERPR